MNKIARDILLFPVCLVVMLLVAGLVGTFFGILDGIIGIPILTAILD